MSEIKPKKTVSRNVAVALGIISILLIAGLVWELTFYSLVVSDRDRTIANQDNQIGSLDSQILDQNNTISSLNTQLAQASNIHILGTEHSTVWLSIQNVNIEQGASWEFDNVSFAGYVLVLVSSSNNSTYAEILIPHPANSTFPIDQTIPVGSEGTAIFPVQPCPSLYVEVGNPVIGKGTITVKITYYH